MTEAQNNPFEMTLPDGWYIECPECEWDGRIGDAYSQGDIEDYTYKGQVRYGYKIMCPECHATLELKAWRTEYEPLVKSVT